MNPRSAAPPSDWTVLSNLALVRQAAGDNQGACRLLRRALRQPGADRAVCLKNLAMILQQMAEFDEAERCCREALRLTPGDARTEFTLGVVLLALGRYAEGWPLHEVRLSYSPPLVRTSVPQWRGERLNGKTVLVHPEGGYGDIFQFCRYVPMVAAAGGQVFFAVPATLRRVLNSLPGVTETGPPRINFYCSVMSLPFVFGTSAETIPPPARLHADAAPWSDFLAGLAGLKVGLCWAGRPQPATNGGIEFDSRRSMRLRDLAPLLTVPSCSFVSLQTGPPAAQLTPAAGVHDVSSRLNDWQDTANLMAGLDLIVTVDSAVAHLAGTLGRPTWMLDRHGHDWRWLSGRNDSPWYPALKIYRQSVAGDWKTPVNAAATALTEMAAAFPP